MSLEEPFFAAAAEGRLVIQQCDSCAALRWPPLPGCPECRSRDTTWTDVEPAGTIWSFVVYHRAFAAKYKEQIPYTVAMVQLDAGPYLVGRLLDGERPPAVGDRVVGEFGDDDGEPAVCWRVLPEPVVPGTIGS